MTQFLLSASLAIIMVPVLSATASTTLDGTPSSIEPSHASLSSYNLRASASTIVRGNWGGIEKLSIPEVDTPNTSQADPTVDSKPVTGNDPSSSTSNKTGSQDTTPVPSSTRLTGQPVPLRSLLPSTVLDSGNDHVWVDVNTTVQLDDGDRGMIMKWALSQVGYHPYEFGGADIANGIDCSGYVMRAYEQAGLVVPHGSRELSTMGRKVSLADAAPGDVVAYDGHAALYVGNGMIVHMIQSSGHEDGVYLTPLSDSWMGKAGWSIRRLLD